MIDLVSRGPSIQKSFLAYKVYLSHENIVA